MTDDQDRIRHAVQNGLDIFLQSADAFFRSAPLNELTDLTADGAEHLKQGLVRFPDLMAEEFHDAQHALSAAYGKSKGAMQPFLSRYGRPREVAILEDIGYPCRLPTGPDAAGKPDARQEGGL